jgi:hypothetical protein
MSPARLTSHRREIRRLIRALCAVPRTTRDKWWMDLQGKGPHRTPEETGILLVLNNLRVYEREVEDSQPAGFNSQPRARLQVVK